MRPEAALQHDPNVTVEELAELAGRLADAAARETLPRFRKSNLTADDKDQGPGFDPVTEADRASESAMRSILAAERPDDGIFGEEQARTHGTSGLTWVLDPIDGTRAYISGLPVWGTLIALDDGTRGRIGVIDQPFTGERFMGVLGDDFTKATLTRAGETQAIGTRQGVGMDQATFFTTDPYLFEGDDHARFLRLRDAAKLTRFGTDCYAYGLVALGVIDLVVETGLQAYDIAAHIPLIQAAGGVVTDWEGGDCRWGGPVIAAGSAELHAEAMDLIAG